MVIFLVAVVGGALSAVSFACCLACPPPIETCGQCNSLMCGCESKSSLEGQ